MKNKLFAGLFALLCWQSCSAMDPTENPNKTNQANISSVQAKTNVQNLSLQIYDDFMENIADFMTLRRLSQLMTFSGNAAQNLDKIAEIYMESAQSNDFFIESDKEKLIKDGVDATLTALSGKARLARWVKQSQLLGSSQRINEQVLPLLALVAQELLQSEILFRSPTEEELAYYSEDLRKYGYVHLMHFLESKSSKKISSIRIINFEGLNSLSDEVLEQKISQTDEQLQTVFRECLKDPIFKLICRNLNPDISFMSGKESEYQRDKNAVNFASGVPHEFCVWDFGEELLPNGIWGSYLSANDAKKSFKHEVMHAATVWQRTVLNILQKSSSDHGTVEFAGNLFWTDINDYDRIKRTFNEMGTYPANHDLFKSLPHADFSSVLNHINTLSAKGFAAQFLFDTNAEILQILGFNVLGHTIYLNPYSDVLISMLNDDFIRINHVFDASQTQTFESRTLMNVLSISSMLQELVSKNGSETLLRYLITNAILEEQSINGKFLIPLCKLVAPKVNFDEYKERTIKKYRRIKK